MSMREFHYCDICGKETYQDDYQGDRQKKHVGGVWFQHGNVGLSDTCADCEKKTTLWEARKILAEKIRAIHGTQTTP